MNNTSASCNRALPGKVLSDKERSILGVYEGIKASYRKEYLANLQAIEALISAGYLKKDGRGISITTEGKNQCH